ncbi:DNA-binding transcriptional regulator YbjK [Gracilibacillus alcaliphilus]|nr:DNA-binding transcriptional regulator YbjK [Gracilibacillus alcaliphilus]
MGITNQTRSNIIDTFMKLVDEKGIEAVTVMEIA